MITLGRVYSLVNRLFLILACFLQRSRNVLPFVAAGRAAKVIGAGGKIAGAVTNALLGAGAVRGGGLRRRTAGR